jgi:2-polyprenyl-3-methyl-5-hydroxy-6-metoxy-1,4-benzoquinol methylase
MPELHENLNQWDASYSWHDEGDEWSYAWGGTEPMWLGTLLPRIRAFVPTGTILEIAPGFGRWAQFLKDACDQLIVVDLAERCIEACRERFSSATNIAYHVNDGRSLEMVADSSLDFVFSFDSLVHAEADVIAAYIEQLASKLRPNGVGFMHHSNMGAYRSQAGLARRVPDRLRRRMVLRGLLVNVYGWRAESVTADLVARLCDEHGLQCVSQELVNWQYGRQLTDCISTFTPKGSVLGRENVRVENRDFMLEATVVGRLARLYGGWPGQAGVSRPREG